MTLEQLRKSLASKVKEARDLVNQYKDAEMPQEVSDKLTRILGESDQIKANIATLEGLEGHENYLQQPADTKAAHLGWRESGQEEGSPPVDVKSWREIKIDSLPWDTKRSLNIRFYVPTAVQQKGYGSAFEAYMRKGYDMMGPMDRKTLTEGIDTAGGFWAPEDMQTEIIRRTAIQAQIRSLARSMSTSRDTVKWPKLTYTTDNKYTSGVRLTWTGEQPSSSTIHRVTDPVSGQAIIQVHTAMASLPLSNDLVEDSAFDIIGLGSELFAEAFGLGEDDVFLNGDGVSKPMGILTRVGVGTELIATVASGSASTLLPDGLIDLFYALPSQYRRNARFVMNSNTAKVARKLKDTADRYLWDALNGGLVSAADQDSLLGKGVIYDEFMPDVAGSAEPILFGDFTGYMIVDRVGLSIQRLSEIYAETNVTVLLARKRVGGDVLQPFRFKAQTIST